MDTKPLPTQLDWSAYEASAAADSFGAFSDPFGGFAAPAAVPVPGGGLGAAAAQCVGDRRCLGAAAEQLMCPSYRASGDPLQSPEGRASALQRALAEHGGAPAAFADPLLLQAMEGCLGCKGCKRECPRGVDVAQMRIEVKAQQVAREGLGARDALFARLPRQVARYRRALRLAGGLRNASPWLARLGERLTGVAAGRSVPLPAARPFADPAPLVSPDVYLLVDSFARDFEPALAEAALEVLQAAGYRVAVLRPAADDGEPGRALCCGRSLLSAGLVAEARAEARRLLAALQPALASGAPVLGLEPACLLMLRDEYHSLGLGEAVARLSRQALLLEEFLAREARAGRLRLKLGALPDGGPALLHGHCHQKAFGALPAVEEVLALIPGFRFSTLQGSCCGMAGSYGLEAEHAELSLRMGEATLFPAVRATPATATVIADGFSCRHQILDGTGRRAEHVVLLLQRALRAAR